MNYYIISTSTSFQVCYFNIVYYDEFDYNGNAVCIKFEITLNARI